MTLAITFKTLEIKFEELHDLVVVRHRDTHLPEWSVDTFHRVIYSERTCRWLKRHERAVKQLSEDLLKKSNFQCNVFPSENITKGKRMAKKNKGFHVCRHGNHIQHPLSFHHGFPLMVDPLSPMSELQVEFKGKE